LTLLKLQANAYNTKIFNELIDVVNDPKTRGVIDVAAPIEAMLLKKPPMLQKPALSRTQVPVPSSQKATLSSTPSLNPLSPLDDHVKPSSSLLE
nr:hypothetical protein [Tanacetum cinerariifolium]